MAKWLIDNTSNSGGIVQGNKKQKIQNSRGANDGIENPSKLSPDQLVAEIRKRAKEIFTERGSAAGDALGDWLRAESEIKSRYGIQK